jgi:hypothetical protein
LQTADKFSAVSQVLKIMTIKDFGARVENAWKGLRPVTKKMLVGAMQTSLNTPKPKFSYDAQSDWELSKLLTALDEQANSDSQENLEKRDEINRLTETVTNLLESQTESAEVFIQLAERALARRDFQKIDKLSDSLILRFSVSEVCEIVRQAENPAIRAIGCETLPLFPTQKLVQMLDDSLYEEIAQHAIEQQAFEYELEEARQFLEQFGVIEEMNGE